MPEQLPHDPPANPEMPPDPEIVVPSGYWGALPGESIELYKHLGIPFVHDKIQPHFPRALRGEFSMWHGRDVEVRKRDVTAPESLTRQERVQRLIEFTKSNEKVHLATFLGMSVVGAVGAEIGDPTGIGLAVFTGITNVAFNVYPILLQRYTRLRAIRILDRLQGIEQL